MSYYSEIETFINVKYGDLDTMYEKWITNKIDISREELDFLAFKTGHSIEKLEELKEDILRALKMLNE